MLHYCRILLFIAILLPFANAFSASIIIEEDTDCPRVMRAVLDPPDWMYLHSWTDVESGNVTAYDHERIEVDPDRYMKLHVIGFPPIDKNYDSGHDLYEETEAISIISSEAYPACREVIKRDDVFRRSWNEAVAEMGDEFYYYIDWSEYINRYNK